MHFRLLKTAASPTKWTFPFSLRFRYIPWMLIRNAGIPAMRGAAYLEGDSRCSEIV
jgi:hypothetical protein